MSGHRLVSRELQSLLTVPSTMVVQVVSGALVRAARLRIPATIALLAALMAAPAYAVSERQADEEPRLTIRERVVQTAESWIGTPYVWGGDNPDDGFDCSGLVRFVFQQTLGMELPRIAKQQRKRGTAVAQNQMKPGDLVFFNTRRDPGSHVGIYLGDDRFLHAPSRGSEVRIDDMHSSYWKRRFTGARRLISGTLP
jgi:cell wall-associated NlpC family hydrolase